MAVSDIDGIATFPRVYTPYRLLLLHDSKILRKW